VSAAVEAALEVLLRAARETATARRLAGDAEAALLQSVVDAAATLFEAEASSIALFETEPERLEFRVAGGAQGDAVVGMSVAPTHGIVGYVFSTGQPLALSDVLSDPRFDKTTAEKTGYVPRSIAAVPLIDAGAIVGVLQILDKHSHESFSLRDMDLLAVFARQAAAAIEAARVGRDSERLLRNALASIGGEVLDEEALDELMTAAAGELDRDDEAPFWRLVDRVAQLRGTSDPELELVEEILGAVARHRAHRHGRYGRRSR
jgi:signal transduction protein with GAF and PtsI domain